MKLTIYVRDNCSESARALDIASWIRTLLPRVEIDIINTSRDGSPLTVRGTDGPAYECDGQLLEGNPTVEDLADFLQLFAVAHSN